MSNYIDIDLLFEKHSKFFLKFGRIMYDICTVDNLFYCIYEPKDDNNITDFEVDFLTEKEIDELMEKSEKDGVDYLYERVKEHPCNLDYPPDVIF